jgi:hypothetical protein
MSHGVYVWDPQPFGVEPTTYEEVSETFKKIIGSVQNSPSQRILAFAKQLQDKIVEIDPEDELLKTNFGHYENEIKEHKKAVLSIELPTEYIIEVLRVLVQAAHEHRLVIFDDHMGMIFLPNGHILPESKAEIWKGALREVASTDFPRTKAAFKKWFHPLFENMLAKHGFNKKVKNEGGDIDYFKEVAVGTQMVGIDYQKGREGFITPVGFAVISEDVLQIYKKTGFSQHTPNAFYYQVSDFTQRYDDEITDSDTALAQLLLMDDIIFPLLNAALDIRGLDNIMNGDLNPRLREKMHRSFFIPHCLIVARLAGNPNFDELVLKFESLSFERGAWGANSAAKATELPKLVKYLKEEVKPLV